MKKRNPTTNLVFIIVIAALLGLGAIQGQNIGHLREADAFYRWILTASNIMRVENSLDVYRDPNAPEPRDDELFQAVSELAQDRLPEIPITEEDRDAAGEPWPKIVRAARQGYDDEIWQLAVSPAANPLRERFHEFLREGRLQTAGTQFRAESMYSEDAQVGLTSLFFGFRKLAANFLWLQVDRYWHKGQMHRMVPLMYTSVALDPNFIDAYLLGAWHMAYNIPADMDNTPLPALEYSEKWDAWVGRKEEWYYFGADFLKDGIFKNPRSWELYFDLGFSIYHEKLKDYENAVRYLSEARRYERERWVDRMLFGAQMRNGQYEDAIEGWEWYRENVDSDSPFPERFIPVNRAYLAEAMWEEAVICERAARDRLAELSDQAEAARSEGDMEAVREIEAAMEEARETAEEMSTLASDKLAEARSRWELLVEEEGNTLAKSRLSRLQALEWFSEGRYWEAFSALEVAREEHLPSFDRISDLLIDMKVRSGHEDTLSTSEKMAIERRKDAATRGIDLDRGGARIKRLDCPYETSAYSLPFPVDG